MTTSNCIRLVRKSYTASINTLEVIAMMQENKIKTIQKIEKNRDLSELIREKAVFTKEEVIRGLDEDFDLRGANLEGLDLREVNFSETDLTGVNFTGANLEKSDFNRATLNGAHLSGANFSRAYMKMALLRRCICVRVDFSHANLLSADFREAIIEECDFNRAELGAYFSKAHISKVDFSKEEMTCATFIGAHLKDVNFKGTNLRFGNFDDAIINDADFRGAEMEGITFKGTHLHNVEIDTWEIKKESLVGACISGASFQKSRDETQRQSMEIRRQLVAECLHRKIKFAGGKKKKHIVVMERNQMRIAPLYLGTNLRISDNDDGVDETEYEADDTNPYVNLDYNGNFVWLTMHVTSIDKMSEGKDSIIEISGTDVRNGEKLTAHISCERHSNPDFDAVLEFECNKDYMIIQKNGFWIAPPVKIMSRYNPKD